MGREKLIAIDALIRSPESSDRRSATSVLMDVGGDEVIDRLLVLLQDTNGGSGTQPRMP